MKLLFKTLAAILTLLALGCTTTYPNQNPVGQVFPSVQGTALTNKKWRLPSDLQGKPALLLLGFKQNSQFDIDRWLIGLDQTKTNVAIYELPTVQGMFPTLIQGYIDEGMRSGIPKPIWEAVITIYEDGEKLQKFTGNEKGLNSRVILLDKDGKIVYFHDKGFSVPELNRMRETLTKLKN